MDGMNEDTIVEGEESIEDQKKRHDEILETAKERFKQGAEATRDDFEQCGIVQDFIAGDQWPSNIKAEREAAGRPCLTLDHLSQYTRHVVNGGLMKKRDVRVLSMSGDADDKVGEVLAGMVRQITQLSTAKVAYETGLRHTTQVGWGYWRVKVEGIPRSEGLEEIQIRKIKDPRMVLMDPFTDYPDGRDAKWAFILTKFAKKEFKRKYKDAGDDCQSWHNVDSTSILPYIGEGSIVVAEYLYLDDNGYMQWCIMTPDKILAEGSHHGDAMPIIRVVGEEFEQDGKERRRGMINPSAMDAQRAHNYASSAFVESVALAPLAPFVAEAGQTEQFTEWKDAHKKPYAVLRYKGVSVGGVLVPPPMRQQPPGIPAGWQGVMQNLLSDMQQNMGLAQPSTLGIGGAPVQSGAGIEAQQAPGEVNTFHYTEHWEGSIEQTGRVIIAMIPFVYKKDQIVKITNEEGKTETARINPQQQQAVVEGQQQLNKALERVFNVNVGRYDVAITTGPSTASKKASANSALTAVVSAFPELMKVAGDLVVGSLDLPGADILAKRLKKMLPEGIDEETGGILLKLQQVTAQNQDLQSQVADMDKIIMAEREKAKAGIIEVETKASTEMQNQKLQNSADSLENHFKGENALKIAQLKSETDIEIAMRQEIVKIIVAKIAAKGKIDAAKISAFSKAASEPTHEGRVAGYSNSMQSLSEEDSQPAAA